MTISRNSRKQIAAEARGLGDYALNGIPAGSQYAKEKPDIARRAIDLWGVLIKDDPNSPLGKEGKEVGRRPRTADEEEVTPWHPVE